MIDVSEPEKPLDVEQWTRSEFERACTAFLYYEAQCLDNREFDDWLALLESSIDYKVPIRIARENWDGSGISNTAYYLDEDHSSIRMRVKRLASRYAWAESPATRTRRLVGNVRVDFPSGADGISVRSNVAIFCYRGDQPHPQMITAERFDELSNTNGTLRLRKRVAILDTVVLGLEALSIFL